MKRLTICLLASLLLSPFAVDAQEAEGDIWTVQLSAGLTAEGLKTARTSLEGIQGLWIKTQKNRFDLYAHLFLSREHAEGLKNRLAEVFPNCRVVQTAPPHPGQWLPVIQQIELRTLGHDIPIVAQGVQAYAGFEFPWNSAYAPEGGVLRLRLKTSPVLNQRSTVKVVVEGIPLKTLAARELSGLAVLEVPLNALRELRLGDRLHVELFGNFSITDDRCVDEQSGNLWMIIEPSSSLHVTQRGPFTSLKDFVGDLSSHFTWVSVEKSAAHMEAICRLAGLWGAASPGDISRFTVSTQADLGPNVFIGSYRTDAQLLGANLYLTPRGVDLLSSSWLPGLIVSHFDLHHLFRDEVRKTSEVTFGDLGFANKSIQGVGDLTAVIPFSPVQLGGWPRELFCSLVFAHSPVGEKERAFLKVKLNGVLIETREVMGQKKRTMLSFELPSRYLQARNMLEITFSYYLDRGDCRGIFPQMEVALFQDSFFTIKSWQQTPPLTLSSFAAMTLGQGAVIAETTDPNEAIPLLRLIESLGHQTGMPPRVDFFQDYDQWTKKDYDYALLQLKPERLQPLRPVVDLAPSFRIVHPLRSHVLLDFETSDPVAALQVFYDAKQRPLMIYSERRQGTVSLESLHHMLLSGTPANVGLLKDAHWQVLEVGDKLRVVYPHKRDLSYYWAQYRLAAFLTLSVMVLLFLLYLYRRLSGGEKK